MNQIICSSPSKGFLQKLSGIPDHEMITAESIKELAARMVETPGASCLIVHLRKPNAPWMRFLASTSRSFLYLKTAFVLEKGETEIPKGFTLFRGSPEDPALFKEISAFVVSLKGFQKRGRQRFDWPLNGLLRMADGWSRSYRVRCISASGAFLETGGDIPPPGIKATLSVSFRDFSILTEVEVLASRGGCGNQGPGFGVRFLSLTEGSQHVIDHIVKDELMRHLINPKSPVKIPSIE